MSALELIRRVEALGGRIVVGDGQLHVTAPKPLPEDLVARLSAEKPAIMIALGAPFDIAVSTILTELRPNLTPSLRALSDTRLLALVNWAIIDAWGKTVRELQA